MTRARTPSASCAGPTACARSTRPSTPAPPSSTRHAVLLPCYADETELRPRDREAVIILGSGPNRIGQGIEFDYTCVHAVQELGKDYDTIMVNCNPETVSTDYDMSDRLYFEPLTFEDVLEIYEAEKKMGPVKGVIVQLGGQTPLSLAARLKAAGVPILGTTPESIDLAENRELFGEVLQKADMNAPRYGTALSLEEAREAAHDIGYPVLVRPSYVLGGRGMEIVYDDAQLTKYVNRALEGGQGRHRRVRPPALPAAHRQVPAGRHRNRRRRAVRRRGAVYRRHHGARRGGRRPLR